MSLLSLKNVHAAPWGTTLLHDINFELEAGQTLGIIGPNGAGKTTLLKLLSGDIAPCRGDILYKGARSSDIDVGQLAKTMAVLPQLSLLNFPYSVEEVILLGRTPHSTGAKQDRLILQEVMRATDTLSLQQRSYTHLSGGEKQRVQLARVFAQIWQGEAQSARVLILDEPTTALDLAHQQLIMETLRELNSNGCAIVLVAHDFNMIAAVSQHILALRGGAISAYATPDQVLTPEIFKHTFGVEVAIGVHPVTGKPLVITT